MSNARLKRRVRKYVTRFITDLAMVPDGYVNQSEYYTKCDISYAHNQGYVPAVKLVRSTNDRRGPVFVSKIHADAWVIEDRVRRQIQEQARETKEKALQPEPNTRWSESNGSTQCARPIPADDGKPMPGTEKEWRDLLTSINLENLGAISAEIQSLKLKIDRMMTEWGVPPENQTAANPAPAK